jgi:hypothetical protein
MHAENDAKPLDSYRMFSCGRCRKLVRICQRCDRGNRYCSAQCRQQAREASVRAARQRYSRTEQGRQMHAERQRAYRQRRQGQPSAPLSVTAPPDQPKPNAQPQPQPIRKPPSRGAGIRRPNPPEYVRCHFCRGRCRPFARYSSLTMSHRSRRRHHQASRASPRATPRPRPHCPDSSSYR